MLVNVRCLKLFVHITRLLITFEISAGYKPTALMKQKDTHKKKFFLLRSVLFSILYCFRVERKKKKKVKQIQQIFMDHKNIYIED